MVARVDRPLARTVEIAGLTAVVVAIYGAVVIGLWPDAVERRGCGRCFRCRAGGDAGLYGAALLCRRAAGS